MGTKGPKPSSAAGKAGRPKVFVCRGCCCGTRKKHPHSDARLLEKIVRRGARAAGAKYTTTKCLGPCGQGNIVVVRAAGTYRWFRKMDQADETQCLIEHLAEHGDVEDVRLAHRRMPARDGTKPKG